MLVLKHNAQQQNFKTRSNDEDKINPSSLDAFVEFRSLSGNRINICRHNFKKPGKLISTNIVYKQCFECHVEKNTLHGVTQQQAQQKNLKNRGNREQS